MRQSQKPVQRIKTYTALFIIVCIGAYFRFQAIGYDLPNAYNPDDVYTMERAVAVADGSYHEAFTSHQPLHTLLIGLSIRAVSVFNPAIRNHAQSFTASYRQDKRPFFRISRTIVASTSVATVIVLFLLGRTVAGDAIGLLSALVFSLNILEIQYAHELYADTALTFLTVLTISVLARAYQQKRLLFLIIALCLLGFSIALKITGMLLFPFYIVISINILKHIKMKQSMKTFIYIVGFIITTTALIFLLPVLVNELRFLQTHRFFDTSEMLQEYALRPTSYEENLRNFIIRIRDSTGTLILLTSFLGFYASLKKQNFLLVAIGIYVLFFILIIVSVGQDMWDNNVLPIFPLVSLFAAFGLASLYKLLNSLTRRRSLSFMLCSILFVPGFAKSYWMAHSYAQPDTRTQEFRWFQDHSIDQSRVARDAFTSITLPPSTVLTSRMHKEKLRSFDYVVLSNWYSKHFSEPWRNTPELARFYKEIEDSYRKVEVFSPNDSNVFIDDIELITHWNSWQRLNYIRGPTLSIYTR